MAHTRTGTLLLGEWACLAIIAVRPTHGFAVASRLKPNSDIGRVWSMSRPLTYRAIDQLVERRLIEPVGEEPGIAGGNRTILSITPIGRRALGEWLDTPVEHLRDFRSEFLLKLVLAELNQHDTATMLRQQHHHVTQLTEAIAAEPTATSDVVDLWRAETSKATLAFIERLLAGAGATVDPIGGAR